MVYKLKKAYDNGTTHIVLNPLDFLSRLASLIPKPKVNLVRFHGVFAPHFKYRDQSMKGFVHESAQLHGVESKTSYPIRIPRDKHNLESLSHSGLYPAGEGAGYAGGITSAACDGIRVAEKITEKLSQKTFREGY